MTEVEKLQAAVNILAQQRNDALNQAVGLQVEIADLRAQLDAAKPKDEVTGE